MVVSYLSIDGRLLVTGSIDGEALPGSPAAPELNHEECQSLKCPK